MYYTRQLRDTKIGELMEAVFSMWSDLRLSHSTELSSVSAMCSSGVE
jgi:hypothetical protein